MGRKLIKLPELSLTYVPSHYIQLKTSTFDTLILRGFNVSPSCDTRLAPVSKHDPLRLLLFRIPLR